MADSQNKPPSREEIIQEIARALAERRERRNLTHERVTQSLKIRPHFLVSMENGKWDELPGEVYVRGFLKRYAEFLGLDADALLAPYLKHVDSPSLSPAERENQDQPQEGSRMSLVWIGLGVFFVFGLVNFIRKHHNKFEVDPQVFETPVPLAVQPEGLQSYPANLPELEHQLQVFSPFPLWMRVQSEDKTFEGFIPQNSTWTWSGEGKFSIRLGHTRDVSLQFDGKSIALGENQKKVELPLS